MNDVLIDFGCIRSAVEFIMENNYREYQELGFYIVLSLMANSKVKVK